MTLTEKRVRATPKIIKAIPRRINVKPGDFKKANRAYHRANIKKLNGYVKKTIKNGKSYFKKAILPKFGIKHK